MPDADPDPEPDTRDGTAHRPDLAAELVAMAAEDRRVRSELLSAGTLFGGYHARMRAVHRAHGDRLAQIAAELGGWPGVAAVGADGAGAAFLIAQHDIAAPDLTRLNLGLLRAAVAAGDAEPAGLAYLEDRVRAFEGRPQVYGTQLGWDDRGAFGAWPPVEDPEAVDRLRAEVGLGPLAAHLERAAAGIPAGRARRDPGEVARERADEEGFARSVGWR